MPIEGTGIAITFQSGLLGEILDLQVQGKERAAIPSSHFGTTGAKTYLAAKLMEPGQYVVQAHFDPSDDVETITVTWTDAGAATWATSGFAVSQGTSAPFEDRVVATFTLQLSGATTVTP